MKIGIYSTMIIPTAPHLEQYAGLEVVAGLLAKHYSENKGHEVYLFASEGSYTPKLGKVFVSAPPGSIPDETIWNRLVKSPVANAALKECDIIHDHSWGYYPYRMLNELKAVCHTHHGVSCGFEGKIFPEGMKPNLMGVSPNHAKNLARQSGYNWRGVENGINLDDYPFQKEKQDYFLWVSRLDWFKGCHNFIDICDKMQVKGIITGGSFGDNDEYVAEIKKKIANSKYVKIYGNIGKDATRGGQVGVGITHAEKVKLMQNAKAVILPVQETDTETASVKNYQQWGYFVEPFGLIIPEANSCGTPVVCLPSGGWMHSLQHGVNGFYATNIDEYIYYMKRIDEIKPEECRQVAERRFSYKRMGDEYLRQYEFILSEGGW